MADGKRTLKCITKFDVSSTTRNPAPWEDRVSMYKSAASHRLSRATSRALKGDKGGRVGFGAAKIINGVDAGPLQCRSRSQFIITCSIDPRNFFTTTALILERRILD